ncbi:MAG: hypothetical protein RIC84_08750 [Aggregatilineales bacterium]
MGEILLTVVSELTQDNFIDVPLAEGVDYQQLIAGDDTPVFVTLPIGAVGKSANGRFYDADSVKRIAENVNRNKPGGIRGHMKMEDRATRFDLPSLMWVGAKVGEDGRVYGKAYVPTYAPDVREYVLKQKARRAPIATSIYGTAQVNDGRVSDLNIESVDLADPSRAGVAAAVAVPVITSEMKEDDDMGENQELITELRDLRKQAEIERDEARQQISELSSKIAELQPTAGVVSELAQVFGEGKDVVQEIREIVSENKALKRATLINDIRQYVDELEQVKVPGVKALILEHLGIVDGEVIAEMVPGDLDSAKAKADAYVASHADVIKMLTVAEMGPGALVAGNNNRVNGKAKLDDSDEAKRKAAGLFGLS